MRRQQLSRCNHARELRLPQVLLCGRFLEAELLHDLLERKRRFLALPRRDLLHLFLLLWVMWPSALRLVGLLLGQHAALPWLLHHAELAAVVDRWSAFQHERRRRLEVTRFYVLHVHAIAFHFDLLDAPHRASHRAKLATAA